MISSLNLLHIKSEIGHPIFQKLLTASHIYKLYAYGINKISLEFIVSYLRKLKMKDKSRIKH